MSPPAGSSPVAINVAQDNLLAKHPGSAWRLINTLPLFATLTEDEKEALAGSMKRLTFRKGAVIAAQDTSLTSLMVSAAALRSSSAIGSGHIELTRWFLVIFSASAAF